MSKRGMLWVGVPILLLASPWPAWLWWKQMRRAGADALVLLGERELPVARAAKPSQATVAQRVKDPARGERDSGSVEPIREDVAFVAGLQSESGLQERVERRCAWANAEQRRHLCQDWVQALSLLRLQHRLAKEAGGVEFAFIGAPGDLLFSVMPDLGAEIDAGRAILRVPQEPGPDATFGSATARFRLEPEHGTLVVEVRTRYGYFDLELGKDCGEPDLHRALWAESRVLWGSLLK